MVSLITSQAVGRSSTFLLSVDKGKVGAIKTFELLERQTSIDPDKNGHMPQSDFDSSFEFRDISFTYPARPQHPIFKGEFSLSGKPNQTLAIVGPSGCGKSTTIAMLQRWYEAEAGEVTVSGKKVQEYQLKALRGKMALVGQEPVLFDVSIYDNIIWGSESDNVPMEKVIEVATMANIHEFIAALPDGYHTRVGDKGCQLSGGQKQRIAIARALIRDPSMLLLDEATSALDSGSEKIVQQALDNASVGRTTVIITHRLSTIQNVDKIAVLWGGRVVELGTHTELLNNNSFYKELVRQQNLEV
uniref:ABC protein n=1 Tax=Physarum polycephalum TaxID=5791 RepID=Q9NKY3_PHYPO|nr:ABC protein [Physarum polycephalum]